MFTGIVDGIAQVKDVQKKGRGLRLVLKVPSKYRKLKLGSSVAVDGVCLTVVSRASSDLSFDVIHETLKRTRLGGLKPGEKLNLERPLRWKGRVDGHLVQGHVDAVARVTEVSGKDFHIAFPARLQRLILPKGSIALNGVSLTVGRVAHSSFWVHVIPHTLLKTNLKLWKPGSRLHLETDIWLKKRFR